MPSVPDYVLRSLEPKQDRHIRLASQANVSKPQACQACQQRKRKCDRKRPSCSMCEKRKIECVFDVKITDRSHPNFLTDLLKSLEEKDQRIKVLEDLIRSRVPSMPPVETLSVNEIAAFAMAVSPSSTSLQTTPYSATSPSAPARSPCPLVAGQGSEPLSPSLLAHVEEMLGKLDLKSTKREQPAVVSYMHSQLGGVNDGQRDSPQVDHTDVASWPPYGLAVQVVKVYVECSAYYPIFRLNDLLNNLEEIYQPHLENPGNPDDRATPLQTYTLFLVFALGFVWLARKINGEKIDTSLLCNRALSCLNTVLRTEPAVSCVTAIFLLSFWSCFDYGGPDIVPLVPIISELVIKLGLHHEPPHHLTEDEKDRRRILFWAIFCQERAMSGVLPTPVSLLEEDITIVMPTRLDPIGTLAEGLHPVAFYNHNIAMRRIFWAVNLYVLSPVPTADARTALETRLDEWYKETPRPQGHTDRDGFFDLYYHTIRANLYRPHTLVNLPVAQLAILKDSAANTISIALDLYQRRKYFDNYFHLYNATSMGLTLLYTLLLISRGAPEVLLDHEWRLDAVTLVGRSQILVRTLCKGWPFSRGLSRAFDALAGRIISSILSTGEGQFIQPPPEDVAASVATLSIQDTFPNTLDFLPPNSDVEWNTWLHGSIGHLTFDFDMRRHSVPQIHHQQMNINPVELDNLMSTFGWATEWSQEMELGIEVPGG